MKKSHAELLHHLSTELPFFSSREILVHVVARSLWIIGMADEEFAAAAGMLPLRPRIEHLSTADQMFLFRSGPVRDALDTIHAMLGRKDGGGIEQARVEYEALHELLLRVVASSGEDGPAWEAIGFDTEICLTAPYPLITTVWRGGHPEPDASVWSEGEEVVDMFRRNSPDEMLRGLELVAPSSEQVDALYDALGLLATISPFLLHDVSMNVRHLCLIEPGAKAGSSTISGMPMSMTYHGFPGCAFLSPGAFGSIPLLAELIYHEALHIKLTNLIAVQPIYRREYVAMPDHRFPCPWISADAGRERLWPFDRALAAFHVYVHLHVLYGVLLDSPGLLPEERALDRRRTAETKGTILRDWVAGEARNVLTGTGEALLADLCVLFAASIANVPSPGCL